MKPLPTIILNLIVGLPCAYMFLWLFPICVSMQTFTSHLTPVTENVNLILLGAYGVLFVGIYGIVAAYCLFTAGYESVTLIREYIKERRGWL